MVFSSLIFLFIFLPAFLGIYYLTPGRFKNYTALAASLLFYAWGAPWLVFYLAASCIIDYLASRLMVRSWSRPSTATWIMAAAITANLSLLIYFKYANFFVREVNLIFSHLGVAPIAWSEVALPIGISFFTFHRVSYVVDVYRKVTPPARRYADYLLYVVLFPQLIAGPIVRYHDVSDSIVSRTHSLESFFEGVFRFVVGLGKKVLLANVVGEAADRVFGAPPGSLHPFQAWLGIVCYAFQIYFDFSAYSDMAVGLARMMGIPFPENFNLPYISRNITEFWRRWHISLSSFMRDYLYFPLGGSRSGRARTYFNLWVVFLISGLWHGASWNFILWGAYHGLFLAADKMFWLAAERKLPKAISVALTFTIVLFGWVLFRSPDLGSAIRYAGRMTGLTGVDPVASPIPWRELAGPRTLFTLALAALISFLPAWDGFPRLRERWAVRVPTDAMDGLKFASVMLVTVLSVSYLCNSGYNPFIYFRF
jgi:alginate O-acetyltransferase complex protein AlgI